MVRRRNMYIFKPCPILNWNCRNCGRYFLLCFWNLLEMITLKELTILIPNSFLTGDVPTKDFTIRTQFVSLDKKGCVFSSSSLFSLKSFFAWNCKLLQILIQTEKTRETIINAWYFIDVQYSFTGCNK